MRERRDRGGDGRSASDSLRNRPGRGARGQRSGPSPAPAHPPGRSARWCLPSLENSQWVHNNNTRHRKGGRTPAATTCTNNDIRRVKIALEARIGLYFVHTMLALELITKQWGGAHCQWGRRAQRKQNRGGLDSAHERRSLADM